MFEQVSTPEDLEGKLVRGDYDILLNTINIGLKKDVLKILTTDDPLINPSKYTKSKSNSAFLNNIQKQQINLNLRLRSISFLEMNMPFVILGYPYDFVGIKEDLIGTGNVST